MIGWFAKEETKSDQLVMHTCEYILSRPHEVVKDLRESDIAETMGVDLISLSSEFNKKLKMSVADYLTMTKINQARLYLEEDFSITIIEVANLLGFESVDHFEREFEKLSSIKPARYQEIMRQKQERGERHEKIYTYHRGGTGHYRGRSHSARRQGRFEIKRDRR